MRWQHVLGLMISATILLNACALSSGAPNTAETPGPPVELGTDSPPVVAPATTAGLDAPLAGTPDAPVIITFAAAREVQSSYERLIQAFERENPTIQIRFVDVETLIKPVVTADGTFTTAEGSIREIMSGADTADISPTPEAIAKGWVRNLRPLMDADPSFDRDDFYPNTLEAFAQAGQSYLLPSFQWVELLAYNKDLWEQRGLPPPSPNWTWGDLKAAAEQLVQKRGKAIEVYGMLEWDSGYRALLAELADAGVHFDPSASPRLDRPEIVAALERAAALTRSGAVYLPTGGWGSPEAYRRLVLDQKVAIWPADILDSSAQPAFAVGTVPFPAASVGVGGYVMSGGTQHPQVAWRWLAFLSRQPVVWPFGGTGPVPARKSVAESSGYWKRLDAQTLAAYQAVVGRPAAPLLPEFGPRAFVLVRQALRSVALGEKSANQALREAQQQFEQQLAQEPPEQTPATDQIIVAAPPPVAAPGATTIVFAAPGGGNDPIDQVARAFNQQNPSVFVQVKHINLPGGQPQLAALAAQADCFAASGPSGSDEFQALFDIRPLIDADPTFRLDDYPGVLLAPFQHQDRLYGLPHAVDFRVLNYNQTLFDTAGIAHPSAAWTLDDLALIAQSLTRGTGNAKQYGFASLFLQWRDVFFFLDRLGASATAEGGDVVQPNFTEPQVVAAVRAYLDLLRATSPHQRLTGYIRGEAIDTHTATLVDAGRVGMWFDFGTFGANASRYTGFTHAVAPAPLGAGPLSPNDVRVTGLYISAKTQHAEACWSWLTALSGDLPALQGAFPARVSLAESDAFAAHAWPGAAEVYKAYRHALDRTPPDAPTVAPAAQSEIDYYWFFRAIDRALQGQDLERELADAQALTEQFLGCVRGGAQASDCAKQVDPSYQGWRNSALEPNP